MPPHARKLMLVLHLAASAVWAGTEACLLALAAGGLLAPGGRPLLAAYLVAGRLGSTLVLPAVLAALATGLLLSLGTPWGLLRYYWVLTKFLLTTGLLVTDLLAVDHLLSSAAVRAASLQAGSGAAAGEPRALLVFAAAGQLCLLLAALVLAVYKPWGRTGFRRRTAGRSAEQGLSRSPAPPGGRARG